MLLIDDHPWVVEAIAELMRQQGWDPVHVAADTLSGQAIADRHRPDLVSIDLSMSDDDDAGFRLLRTLRREHPHMRLVILTGEVSPTHALEAIRSGARAFIPKSTSSANLLAAFDAVHAGFTWLPIPLIGSVLHAALNPPPPDEWQELVASLSSREQEVLGLMVSGLDRREIADDLVISFNTARTHVKNILTKLGAHSTLEAVSIARRAGGTLSF